MKTPLKHAGFSIVEVMVALVVLAVGMLGIASLYVTTLRSSGSAMSRMQAVNLVTDLSDRIRANRLARDAYALPAAEKQCIGVSKTCSQEDMAANDLFLWQQQIDFLLPGTDPEGQVVYVAGAADEPDRYTITVRWKEPGAQESTVDANGFLSYALMMQVDRP